MFFPKSHYFLIVFSAISRSLSKWVDFKKFIYSKAYFLPSFRVYTAIAVGQAARRGACMHFGRKTEKHSIYECFQSFSFWKTAKIPFVLTKILTNFHFLRFSYKSIWFLLSGKVEIQMNFIKSTWKLSISVVLWLYKESTHSKVDAPTKVKCPYGHRLSCLQTG